LPFNDPYRAVHDRSGFLERQDLGRLRLRGQDRRSYLHGILTNDIEGLAAGDGCYAALLTPQGRFITDMHVYELGDEVLITLPRSLASAIRDRLDQFIFTEDVHVDDVTEATAQLGVYGPEAGERVSPFRAMPDVTVLASRDLGIDGFEVIAPSAQAGAISRSLREAGVLEIDGATAETIRVESGIPKFLVDMTTDTIPLEAGIEERAISMTKGCYPGQEVIVRVLHRGGGRVAKKLVGLVLPVESAVPAAGEKVKADDREIGVVTSAVLSRRLARPIALGYVHRDFVTPGTRVTIGGAAAEVSALPF
jgi:folate-binding protein YgfZ